MSFTTSSLGAALRLHPRAFAVSIVVSAFFVLAARSSFLSTGGEMVMAQDAPAAADHEGPGHDGHSHDGAPDDAPDDAAPAAADASEGGGGQNDEHAGHDMSGDGMGGGALKESGAGDADGAAGGAPDAGFVPVLLDLGNASCPVMKGDVDGEVFTEWNGLRVGHCCPGCKERFLKNPESLLDDVSPMWRDVAAAAAAIDQADGEEREALLAKAAQTWTVVRKPLGTAPAAQPGGLLIDVGNTNCPVMGGEVDGEHFSEWNGLRVGHCCPGCAKRFLADPEDLLDEAAPDWREAAAAVRSVNESEGAARAEALATLRKKWTVVREPAAADVK